MGASLEKRRQMRRQLVFDVIKRNNNLLSRNDLCKKTPYSMTAIAETVDELIRDNRIIEIESSEQRIGRPPVLLAVNPRGCYYVGIECSSYSVSIEVIDSLDESVYSDNRYLSHPKAKDLLEEIKNILGTFSEQYPDIWEHVFHVALSLPGKVDVFNGVGISYDGILDWKNVDVKGFLEQYFSKSFIFMNNIDSMLIGYRFINHIPEENSIVFIMIRNGIGVRFFTNHTLLSKYGIVCEFGHTKAENSSRICACGKKGCYNSEITTLAIVNKLKEYISVYDQDLARRFQDLSNEHEFISEFFTMVREENHYALEIFDECTRQTANLISQVLLICNVDTMVLSTELCHVMPRFQQQLGLNLSQNKVTLPPQVDYLFPQNNFGAIGAALSGYQSQLSDLADY